MKWKRVALWVSIALTAALAAALAWPQGGSRGVLYRVQKGKGTAYLLGSIHGRRSLAGQAKGGRLPYSILRGLLRLRFRLHNGVGDMRLFQKGFGNTAVGAGGCGEQERRLAFAFGMGCGRGGNGVCRRRGVRASRGRCAVLRLIDFSLAEFLQFTVIPVFHRAIIPCDAAVHFGFHATVGASVQFPG